MTVKGVIQLEIKRLGKKREEMILDVWNDLGKFFLWLEKYCHDIKTIANWI